MKHYNIPIFISHYGCPNDCVFCNQKKINGVDTDIRVEDIHNIIETNLKTIPINSKKEVAFFGGTFTGIPIEKQIEYLNAVETYVKEKKIDGIRLSTRPDYINENIMKNLSNYTINVIELGIQSFDEKVLNYSKRYYTKNTIYNAIVIIRKKKILLGLQMMPGLYGASYESDIKGIKEIIGIKPDIIRIYPTLVIKNTILEKLYKEKKYVPLSMDEAVDIAVQYIANMELNNIKIIKMGLQPSDDLREPGIIVSGPFHSAFRELVEGEIYYRVIRNFLYENGIINKIIHIKSNEKTISRIKGINKINEKKLNIQFKILIDKNIKNGDIIIGKDKEMYISREEILGKIIIECE